MDRPHWSEEADIFATEISVQQQRAEQAAKLLDENLEAARSARFQRQFKKKDAGSPTKKKTLDASEMFRLVDEDSSGEVSAEELKVHMLARGYSSDEVKDALKILDTDGDGQISAKEARRPASHIRAWPRERGPASDALAP